MINQKMWFQYITLALVTMAFATTTNPQKDAPWCKNLKPIHCAQHSLMPKSCPSICQPIKKMESLDGDGNIQVIQGPPSPISESITNSTSMDLKRDGSIQGDPSSINESINNSTSMDMERIGSIQGPPSPISESINNLTVPSPRIIGGFVVNQNMPWIVALLDGNDPFCSGSLINNQYILTAAHCVSDRLEPDCRAPLKPRNLPFQAVIGEKNYNYQRQMHQVVDFWTHPQYNHRCNNWNDDFAVLKLQQPVSNSPVCLHSGSPRNNIQMYAIGYGQSHMMKGGSMSSDLRAVEVADVDLQQCSQYWGTPMPANKVCTGGAQWIGGTCSGDSGGPLVLKDPFGFVLAGVTSYGSSDPNMACNKQLPDVYGRVSSALTFIESKAGSIKTC